MSPSHTGRSREWPTAGPPRTGTHAAHLQCAVSCQASPSTGWGHSWHPTSTSDLCPQRPKVQELRPHGNVCGPPPARDPATAPACGSDRLRGRVSPEPALPGLGTDRSVGLVPQGQGRLGGLWGKHMNEAAWSRPQGSSLGPHCLSGAGSVVFQPSSNPGPTRKGSSRAIPPHPQPPVTSPPPSVTNHVQAARLRALKERPETACAARATAALVTVECPAPRIRASAVCSGLRRSPLHTSQDASVYTEQDPGSRDGASSKDGVRDSDLQE